MKTQYFRRPRSFISPRQGAYAALAVGIVLILIALRIFAPGAFTALMSPVWGVGTFLSSQARLTDDAAALEARALELAAENETLRNEKQALAAALADGATPHAGGISAGVIARPPLSPYDVLVIGKGSGDGIYAGMQAFSKGVPVGTVESAAPGSARVLLYSASGRTTEGWVGEKRTPVTLKGLGGGAFQADLPRESGAAEGDAVYVPGPGALPMGVIVSIESNASSPRSTVRIRPWANPFTMTNVSLVAAPSL